jgi:hypothetical protein
VQYAALFALRTIKHEGVDDSDYLHSLTYVDLDSEQFVDIEPADVVRLRDINAALKHVIKQRAVPKHQMQRALTAEQYTAYVDSFDWDISHVESDESDALPWQLRDYMDKIQQGDRYTRIANMFRRSKKRDAQGRTAFGRYESAAESCYEDALMDLVNAVDTDHKRNPNADSRVAGEIQRCLDRDVNPEPGYTPYPSAAGVPRVRGTRSKYTLVDDDPVVGSRLRKHWRQREALTKAALELVYAEPEEAVLTDEQRLKLRNKLDALLRNDLDDRD